MSDLYELAHARHPDQLDEMRRLQDAGVCLFCPADAGAAMVERTVHRVGGWAVVKNMFPYANTTVHLLAVPDGHYTDLADLAPQLWGQLREVLVWARDTYRLAGYAVAARCGDLLHTGGSVAHLHVHLIVADVTAPPVRFTIGRTPSIVHGGWMGMADDG